jgi:hypothetical protein
MIRTSIGNNFHKLWAVLAYPDRQIIPHMLSAIKRILPNIDFGAPPDLSQIIRPFHPPLLEGLTRR